MNELEQHLLHEAIGSAEPRLIVRSRTRMDTGRWWRPTPLWLCVMADEVVMVAVSRRRYLARLPLDACAGSYYCHASGELVVEPGEALRVNRFRVTPREALELLKSMGVASGECPRVSR